MRFFSFLYFPFWKPLVEKLWGGGGVVFWWSVVEILKNVSFPFWNFNFAGGGKYEICLSFLEFYFDDLWWKSFKKIFLLWNFFICWWWESWNIFVFFKIFFLMVCGGKAEKDNFFVFFLIFFGWYQERGLYERLVVSLSSKLYGLYFYTSTYIVNIIKRRFNVWTVKQSMLITLMS